MYKYIKIILGNTKNNLLRRIIGMVIVGISIFLLNVTLSRFMYQEYLNSLVRDCGLYNNYMYSAPPDKDVYFQDDNSTDLRAAALNYVHDNLEKLRAEGEIFDFYNAASFNGPIADNPDERAYYLLYPKDFLCDIKFPITKGVWFDKYNFDDNTIPAVIGSDLAAKYKIGGKYKFRGIDTEVKIIGVLDKNAMVLRCGAGGNGIDLNSVFINGNDVIIACTDNMDYSVGSGATIIKVSEQYQHNVLDCISDIVYTFSFKELSDTAYENNRLITEMQFVVFALMMVVCITGVSSNNLLETIRCKKKYAIYFMCGMNWKCCIRISFIDGLINLIIPTLMGYTAFLKWREGQDFNVLRITNANIILTILFIISVFALTSLMPLLDIKNTSPVKIISET